MSLCFKKAYKNILEVRRLQSEKNISLKDAVFAFFEFQLLSFASALRDDKFFEEIWTHLECSGLEKNFEKLVSLFRKKKGKFLKKKIFLVFGRNIEQFKIVENYIKKAGFICDLLSIEKIKGGTKIIFSTLIEKISSSFKVIVVLSADDIGKLNNSKEKFTLRPRLNVVLETGLSFGILDKNDVLLLWDTKISSRELITDLGGCYTINISEDSNWKKELMQKLKEFNKEWKNNSLY